MIIQIIRLKSGLSLEELTVKARERGPEFKALPGLLQKYYVKLAEPDAYGGVYIWDSENSMRAFRESELAATIAESYKVKVAPEVENMEVLFQLRD